MLCSTMFLLFITENMKIWGDVAILCLALVPGNILLIKNVLFLRTAR